MEIFGKIQYFSNDFSNISVVVFVVRFALTCNFHNLNNTIIQQNLSKNTLSELLFSDNVFKNVVLKQSFFSCRNPGSHLAVSVCCTFKLF